MVHLRFPKGSDLTLDIGVATKEPEEMAALMTDRTIARVDALGPPGPGFAGGFHTAVEVIAPDDLPASDPFVLLMDDRMDVDVGREVGGPHPHAGLETVTFVLAGEMRDRDEGVFKPGDAVWMS